MTWPTVPARRRLQARAAVTGSVDDFARRVRATGAVPFGGWQASLSVIYMLDYVARSRQPAEVAAIARAFRGGPGEQVVLDTVSMREPADLAAVMAADGTLAGPLLRRVITRRLPAELAGMLDAMPEHNGLRRQAVTAVLEHAPIGTVAHVILHLRGMSAAGPLNELQNSMVHQIPSAALAEFLAIAARYTDAVSVQEVIDAVAAWQVSSPEGTIPDVGRIARLVRDLLENGHMGLAQQVTDRTLEGYATSGQRYRLYALVFVFKKRGLDDEAARVMKKVPAGASAKEANDLIVRFCQTEEPDQAAALLHTILENPEPEVTMAAVEFTRRLEQHKQVIFSAAAAWTSGKIAEFEKSLAGYSGDWAEEFRDLVASGAPEHPSGADSACLLSWLHRDAKRDKERARIFIEKTVQRKKPEILVAMILGLWEDKSWWSLHRSEFARRVSGGWDAASMAALVRTSAEDGCLPSALWLAQDWLAHQNRTNADVIQVVRSMRDAAGNPGDLRALLRWAGHSFLAEPGQRPALALAAAGLADEANAWHDGERRMRVTRPDPDPSR